MPFIAMWLESTRGLIGIVYGIIYIAVAILVLNAMLMAVFERIREFGVMKAIGYAPSTVFGVIAVESAIQTAIGTLVGLLFALPVMYYLATVGIDTGALGGMSMMGMSMQQNWMGVYSPQVLATPIAVLWFMVGAAAMLPALRAARISPVAAMRHR
jgi:putative ABC transport system permease protein